MSFSPAICPSRAGNTRRALSRGSLLAIVAAGVAACSGVNVVKQQGVELPPINFSIRKMVYPSGLTVLAERDDRTKLAGIFLVVGSGSTSDPAGKEGLAHYVEHLTFRSRPLDDRAFRQVLEESGGFFWNAFTSLDQTVYFELGLASDVHELLRLEGARMLHPIVRVPDAVARTELDVVKNELHYRNETGFVGDVFGRLQTAVFPEGHPYARPVIGSLETLSSLGVADAEAFVAKHYRPDNMTLLILGNVDLQTADRLLAESLPQELLVAREKVHVPARMAREPPAVPPTPQAPAALERKVASIPAPELWIAWSLPRSFDTDEYLLNFIAGLARARLSRVMFDDKDIATIESEIYPGIEASMLLCRVVLHRGEHPEETRDRILKDVPRIFTSADKASGFFDEVGFSMARRIATIEEVSNAQNLVERGLKRASITHFSQDPSLYSRAIHDLTAMRRKQLNDYAEPYVSRERARSILFVPPPGALTTTVAASAVLPFGSARNDRSGPTVVPHRAGDFRERLHRLVPNDQRVMSRMPNGITVVLERRAGLPLVTAEIQFPTVPRDTKEAAAAEIARFVGGPGFIMNGAPGFIGSSIESTYGRDYVAYSIEGASGNTELLLATLAEYARSLKVDRSSWLFVQDYFVPFWKRLEQDPHTVASSTLRSELLAGTAYAGTPTDRDIAASSQSAANGWIEQTHVPVNATLTVVGEFDPVEVAKYVQDSFGRWGDAAPQKQPTALSPATPSHRARSSEMKLLVADRPGATQAELHFACLLPEVKDSATATRHEVGARLLEDRLHEVLREEMGSTYGTGVEAIALRGGTAYLDVNTAVETGKLMPVLTALQGTLRSVEAGSFSPDELASAKMKRAGAVAAASMTNHGIARTLLTRARLGFTTPRSTLAEEIDAVSSDDVRAQFGACLAQTPTLSIVGDEKSVRPAVQAGWK